MHTSVFNICTEAGLGKSTHACMHPAEFSLCTAVQCNNSPLKGAPLKGTCSVEQSGESWQTASCISARLRRRSEKKPLRFSIIDHGHQSKAACMHKLLKLTNVYIGKRRINSTFTR